MTDLTGGIVEVRLTGYPLDVEKVAEYLRSSRALNGESEDMPCLKSSEKVYRFLDVRCDEKAGGDIRANGDIRNSSAR